MAEEGSFFEENRRGEAIGRRKAHVTGGSWAVRLLIMMRKLRAEMMHRVTRAGAAVGAIQKDT